MRLSPAKFTVTRRLNDKTNNSAEPKSAHTRPIQSNEALHIHGIRHTPANLIRPSDPFGFENSLLAYTYVAGVCQLQGWYLTVAAAAAAGGTTMHDECQF